jgi:virginiamycin A acetyltransferase
MTVRVLVHRSQFSSSHVIKLLSYVDDLEFDLSGANGADIKRFTDLIEDHKSGASCKSVEKIVSSAGYTLFLSGDEETVNGNVISIKEALYDGIAVIPLSAPTWNEAKIDDFTEGWYRNKDNTGGFYAKLFRDAAHIANPQRLQMGLGSTINPRAIILNGINDKNKGGWVTIGRATHVGADCLLNTGYTDFTVGNFSLISANFSAHAMRHTLSHISNFCIRKGPFDFFGEPSDTVSPIKIGNDVWVGEGVTLLPGMNLSDGCVIGAGSVVTKNTEPYGVYAGNPARLIRYRFDEHKIQLLLRIRWWDYPYNVLKEMSDNFKIDIHDMGIEDLEELLRCPITTNANKGP